MNDQRDHLPERRRSIMMDDGFKMWADTLSRQIETLFDKIDTLTAKAFTKDDMVTFKLDICNPKDETIKGLKKDVQNLKTFRVQVMTVLLVLNFLIAAVTIAAQLRSYYNEDKQYSRETKTSTTSVQIGGN